MLVIVAGLSVLLIRVSPSAFRRQTLQNCLACTFRSIQAYTFLHGPRTCPEDMPVPLRGQRVADPRMNKSGIPTVGYWEVHQCVLLGAPNLGLKHRSTVQ